MSLQLKLADIAAQRGDGLPMTLGDLREGLRVLEREVVTVRRKCPRGPVQRQCEPHDRGVAQRLLQKPAEHRAGRRFVWPTHDDELLGLQPGFGDEGAAQVLDQGVLFFRTSI